ncbi:hypothetical protein L596_030796 [Steinernema carpocapsae]|uniref:G-protein coupled receptors family 1 profile domain-containing protein n=1 Tax=Steinernema carpocapsae TaxID=34508 RepID=A0A4U5LNS0_STECR|nr:hypothetical protein L596_030796 [Steinernema carpocapsae]
MSKNNYIYFGVFAACTSVYIGAVLTGTYMTVTDESVLCFVADGMTGYGKDAWALSQGVINASVILIYTKLKGILKTHMVSTNDDTKKIFKSLYLIMLFYICGWFVTIVLLIALRITTKE